MCERPSSVARYSDVFWHFIRKNTAVEFKKKKQKRTDWKGHIQGKRWQICYNFQEGGGNGGFLEFAIKSFDFRIIVFYTSQAGKRFVEIRYLQVRLKYFEFHPYRPLKTENKNNNLNIIIMRRGCCKCICVTAPSNFSLWSKFKSIISGVRTPPCWQIKPFLKYVKEMWLIHTSKVLSAHIIHVVWFIPA